ncbi:malto-oligosyltrehalose trehalohydrolase [Cesiribacter andamanensis]|uniref:Malto-oligosyltrehalose trehalohydrolase n=1 Tax=Cesiribacter andamanensis AMV16 TaxID=1279009 RepID=M7NQW4_9BACT|nr:malto-oligosyltrehalose trehalohydrolase [Cesiribacter andamanensis]EMR00889.1 Malto-oligosyltrehalose trehalohydrolase [Cesiribacter andamanensis AMV16]
MKQASIRQRTLGITFSKGEATACLWAPQLEKAELLLHSQQAVLPLEKDKWGYWRTTSKKIAPGERYSWRLNGERERPDPASLSQPEGPHQPSQALDPASWRWSDRSWQNLPLEDYIFYELHTGTFTPEGTFAGIIQKLDYLKELGITAIELMPVAQFPGERNWGYDGVYPFAVQNSYGGARGLQQLVDACHQRGLAVVLDVVYNHMGPEGNYLNEFGPYFTDKYNTPWGKALNFDDAWCDGVRRYFIENALMWFRDFHIDALRLDAVHAIKDFSPTHFLRELKQQVNELMQETGRPYYLIAEVDLNDTRFIDPLEKGGYGLDAQWIDEFHHALRVSAGQEPTGYYADFAGIEHLAKAYQDAYVYDGQYSPHRHKFFGTRAEQQPGRQFVVFSQNHDQVGNRMLGERSSQLYPFEMQKLLAGAVLVSPYLPMLFMGEEWAETNPFLYFVSHTDAELAEAVRKGRRAEFAHFHAQGEAPDPQAETTFEQSRLQWQLQQQEPHQTMLRWYKALLEQRKKQPALRQLNRRQLEVSHNQKRQTLQLHRWHEGQHVLCLMNFSGQAQPSMLPTYRQEWRKLLDSADPQWGGREAAPAHCVAGDTISLQPQSLVLYTSRRHA